MAKKKQTKPEPKKPKTHYVVLPEGVSVQGYHDLNLSGRTEAYSCRQAVSYVLARRKREAERDGISLSDNFINLVMGELDNRFGGAQSYAFLKPQVYPPYVEQDKEELKRGGKMSLPEILLMKEHAFAHDLAVADHADLSKLDTQLNYLGRARYLMAEMNKVR